MVNPDQATLDGKKHDIAPFSRAIDRKLEGRNVDLDDVTHIKHGKYFELAIAALAMEKWGIQLNKVRRYLVADDCPAGLRHEVRARLQLRLVSADVAADHVERRIGVLAEGRALGRISLGFFQTLKMSGSA